MDQTEIGYELVMKLVMKRYIPTFGISINRFGIPIPNRFEADTESEFGIKKNKK